MGMFDTFFVKMEECPNAVWICSSCNMDFDEMGIQSKAFDQLLETYHIGDVVTSKNLTTEVMETDYCPHCGKPNSIVKIFITKGIFTGVNLSQHPTDSELVNLCRFKLNKTQRSNNEMQSKINKIQYIIKLVEENEPLSRFERISMGLDDDEPFEPIKQIKSILTEED